MIKAAKFVSGLGCLTSLIAPLLAILLYPRANWLFAFVLVGIVVLVLSNRLVKDPTPHALADEIERLLTGPSPGWDVDNFESHRIRDPQLKELWQKVCWPVRTQLRKNGPEWTKNIKIDCGRSFES
jgi:hypothetical protein